MCSALTASRGNRLFVGGLRRRQSRSSASLQQPEALLVVLQQQRSRQVPDVEVDVDRDLQTLLTMVQWE